MEEFEMSFKNPILRIWFFVVLPVILISLFLLIILPFEYRKIVVIGEAITFIIFWIYVYRKKSSQ